jgi:hypothetical protein
MLLHGIMPFAAWHHSTYHNLDCHQLVPLPLKAGDDL